MVVHKIASLYRLQHGLLVAGIHAPLNAGSQLIVAGVGLPALVMSCLYPPVVLQYDITVLLNEYWYEALTISQPLFFFL